ncbi:MAG: guanylate kinase [Planctomycetes bacterium]|nr:guanylate kinase [Planctomycetota bacterium]
MTDSAGHLIIISGPSGAGKSSVVKRLLATSRLPLELSVSATTRAPRPGELHGREYWFLDEKEFQKKRSAGEFLECKEVFGQGIWYGTLRRPVTTGLAAGKWVILEIDVQGALSVQREYSDAISIFLHPGSMEELERRLRLRATDSEDSIKRRLDVAAEELALRHCYCHEIVNETIDKTVKQLDDLLHQYQGEKIPCSKS